MEQFKICNDCDFAGVYAIYNTDIQKIYIGSSKNIRKRLGAHKTRLENNTNSVKEMQKDFNNGNNFISFVVTPVTMCAEKGKENNNLKYFEDKAIHMFYSYYPNQGYNKNGTCSQLAEILNIMDAREILEKSNVETLFNKKWRL